MMKFKMNKKELEVFVNETMNRVIHDSWQKINDIPDDHNDNDRRESLSTALGVEEDIARPKVSVLIQMIKSGSSNTYCETQRELVEILRPILNLIYLA